LIKTAKSIYDPPEPSDGRRVLVMTLWPRGISKEKVDVWMKELGTPRETMKKWKAGKITWEELTREYKESLKGKEALLETLSRESRRTTITLLCVERDESRCHRSILRSVLEGVPSEGHPSERGRRKRFQS
jgi:uncharacterized protein YeaO (DUF488 family)